MAIDDSKITTELAVDSPKSLAATYRVDTHDRRYIDNQILGMETHLVDALIRGRLASYFKVVGGGTRGFAVCAASDGSATDPSVKVASTSNVATANGPIGVLAATVPSGAWGLVVVGGSIPKSVHGLAGPGYATVSSTGALTLDTTPSSVDYVVGYVDTAGWLRVDCRVGTYNSGGGASGDTDDGTLVQAAAEVETTDTTPTQIGATFSIPADSMVSVDSTILVAKPGAEGAKIINVHRAFANQDGSIIDGTQTSPVADEDLDGTLAASVEITRTGSTGRVEVTGISGDLRWREIRQVNTLSFDAAPPPPPFSLSDVAWTLWINSQHVSGTTATGQASAGTSGSHNMTLANSVVLGTGLDTIQSITLNGTSDSIYYSAGGGAGDIIATTAWTICTLVKITAVPSDDALNPYSNAGLGTITNANWEIAIRSTGPTIQAYQYDTGNKIATKALGSGWVLVTAKYDGTNIKVRVGKGSWASTVAGAVAAINSGPFRVGVDYAYSQFLTGELLEYFASNTAVADATLDQVADALVVKYPSLVV